MKFSKLAFIFKKNDTLRDVTFLYTKIQTLCKKQENVSYFFIYKNPFQRSRLRSPSPPPREWVKPVWIYEETWAATEARVTDSREGDQRTVHKLSRWIRAGLITDRKRQTEDSCRTTDPLITSDPPPGKRGMGPDAGVLKGYGQ